MKCLEYVSRWFGARFPQTLNTIERVVNIYRHTHTLSQTSTHTIDFIKRRIEFSLVWSAHTTHTRARGRTQTHRHNTTIEHNRAERTHELAKVAPNVPIITCRVNDDGDTNNKSISPFFFKSVQSFFSICFSPYSSRRMNCAQWFIGKESSLVSPDDMTMTQHRTIFFRK